MLPRMSSYLLSWSVVIYEYKMIEKDTLITKHQAPNTNS